MLLLQGSIFYAQVPVSAIPTFAMAQSTTNTPVTDSYRSYTGLEQWLFLEVNALQERVQVLEARDVKRQNQYEYQEEYIMELEARMEILERTVMRCMHWNNDPAPVHEVAQEESMNDDLIRLLDQFDQDMADAEESWHAMLFGEE